MIKRLTKTLAPLLASSAMLAGVAGVVGVVGVAGRARAEGEGETECLPPPDFEAWCSTGARTGVHVETLVGDDGPELIVRLIVGEPIEGVEVGSALQLDCMTELSPTCQLPAEVALLLTSATTFGAREPVVNDFQILFVAASNPVSVQDALQAAVSVTTTAFGEPGLCVENLFGLSDTERDQGLESDSNCADDPDGIFCGAGNGVDMSLLAMLALTWRRRRRA